MRARGPSSKLLRPAVLRPALALLAILLCAFSLSACGGSDEAPAAGAPSNIITEAEIGRYPQGSVERAFMQFWSDLQYQSWAEMASYFDPQFLDRVGTAPVIAGKKLNAGSYPQLKPEAIKVRAKGDVTTVRYQLRFSDGTKELASTSWRQVDGSWQIIYDSRLDTELAQVAENDAEIELNGVVPSDPEQQPSPEAARAANEAEKRQARFLQQEIFSGT